MALAEGVCSVCIGWLRSAADWTARHHPGCRWHISNLCCGYGPLSKGPPCCSRAGEYDGTGSDGPLLFNCPAGCGCHD